MNPNNETRHLMLPSVVHEVDTGPLSLSSKWLYFSFFDANINKPTSSGLYELFSRPAGRVFERLTPNTNFYPGISKLKKNPTG